jgi:hypothetical protein
VVQTFVVAVTGRPSQKCRNRELDRVLAYVELTHMLRTLAGCQQWHDAVARRGAEVI